MASSKDENKTIPPFCETEPAAISTDKKSKPKEEAMPGLELKRTISVLWTNKTPEEKTPIIRKKNKLTENGTIPMDRSVSSDDIFQKNMDIKPGFYDSIDSKKDEPQNMSLLRKLCFFLSINAGVMYVVVLGWLLPCRMSKCLVPEDSWTANLTNINLTTNLEMNAEYNPSLVIFGYSKQGESYLAAIQMSDGKSAWNESLKMIPQSVYCSYRDPDSNTNSRRNCFVTADNSISAFDSSTGNMIWEHNFPSDQIISKVSVMSETKDYIMCIADEFLYLIDAVNGTEVSKVTLPCSWTTEIKITGPWKAKKGPLWGLMCEYGDSLEIWSFKERELIHSTNSSKEMKFRVVFSEQQSYSGSIDLAGDVTSTSRSLFLSWADMVAMVTAQAPSHHLLKAWERHFLSPLGYTVDVTSIITGHFISKKSLQLAVAVQDGTNSTVHLLELKNGSTIVETELGPRSILSLMKIQEDSGKDIIFIESAPLGNKSTNSIEYDCGHRNYFTVQYSGGEADLRHVLASEDVCTFSLSPMFKGSSNLLLAVGSQNGELVIHRIVIKTRDPETNSCVDDRKHNNSGLLFFE